ncbi:unnamed protein product, partial [Symbiodinium natans]
MACGGDKQAHRLPGCCLTVLPGPRQCIQWQFYRSYWPPNVMRALASLPTNLMGLGSGGTITYQIAISEAHATFRACICMGPIRLPSLLPAPTGGKTRISVCGGRKDVETFQHHLRMCYSVRGNHRVPP